MSKVFPRHTKATLPLIRSGEGVYLTDETGKRYLDGSSGAVVSCLGHSNPRLKDAIKAQADSIAWAHTAFFSSEPAEELARKLAELAPGDIDRVYFVSGGSEAMEAAIKLARQYHLERGQPERKTVVSRWQSYHGNTLGALSVGGNRLRRKPYGPMLFDGVRHIEPCHHWRWAGDGESPEEYGLRMANQLEEKILEEGQDTVSAFVAETIVGASMGAVPATPGYFKRIREICDRYGVLLILDEVMCGMGRTGSMFACEAEGVAPDIVCVAKGLGAGMLPLGAMMCDRRIYDAIEGGSGFFQHGHTYIGHPTCCAVGCAVLDEIRDQDLLPKVEKKGALLSERLRERIGGHPKVGNIRGRGLFWGVEFVADQASKEPLPPEDKTHARIKQAAFSRGLMVYALGGTVDGDRGDHIILAPPFIIEDGQLDELVDKAGAAVEDVLGN